MDPATDRGAEMGAALTVLAMDALERGQAAEAEALFGQVRCGFAAPAPSPHRDRQKKNGA